MPTAAKEKVTEDKNRCKSGVCPLDLPTYWARCDPFGPDFGQKSKAYVCPERTTEQGDLWPDRGELCSGGGAA